MYDRKTWILLALCLAILGGNFYYAQKNQQAVTEAARIKHEQDLQNQAADAERVAAQIEEAKKAAAENPAANPGAAAPSIATIEPKPAAKEVLVTFETADAIFTLTSKGGGVKTVQIKKQNGALGPVLLNREGENPVGALTKGADNYESADYEYVAAESNEGNVAVFRGKADNGMIVTKTWNVVTEGEGKGYQLGLVLGFENPTDQKISLKSYELFLGAAAPVGLNEKTDGTQLVYLDGGSIQSITAASFAGGMFKSSKDLQTATANQLQYAGVVDQFFATVLRPAEGGKSTLWAKTGSLKLNPDRKAVSTIRAAFSLPDAELAKGERRSSAYRLFAGPKNNKMLRTMAAEQSVAWGDLMAYGPASKIAQGMNWLLNKIHNAIDGFTGKASWGIAVILLTLLIRGLMWPLYNQSNRTAKRMAKLKPEMDKLKEKYPDDPTKVSQETMALYQKYGINPLGSCLPMFAQLPIFMGFFSMLNHAVEMRGNGFLWIPDLAEPDTYAHIGSFPVNILPIVMAVTSMIQMSMMPNMGGDPTQAATMKLMPLLFLYICYSSPAALALYWTTSNLFTIFQTWLSKRMPEPELKVSNKAGKKGFLQRMAEQAEEQKRMQKGMRQANGRVVDSDDDSSPKKRPPRTGG